MKTSGRWLACAAALVVPLPAQGGPPEPPLLLARPEGNFVELGARRNTESRTHEGGDEGDTRAEERLLTERLHLGLGGYAYHPRLARYHLGGDLTLAQELVAPQYSLLPGGQGTIDLLPEHLFGLTVFGSLLQLQVDRTFARSYEVQSLTWGAVAHGRPRAFPVDVSYTHRESQSTETALRDDGPAEADSRSDELSATGRYQADAGNTSGQVQAVKSDEVIREQEIHRLSATAHHLSVLQAAPHRSISAYASALDQQDVAQTTTIAGSLQLDWGWLANLSSQHRLGYDRSASGGQVVHAAAAGSSLRHQLYQSLTSVLDVAARYELADYGTQRSVGVGLAEDYVKRLGEWGRLTLGVAPRLERSERRTSADSALAVDEPHTLDTPTPARLLNADVDTTEVRVTNEAGIPYREGSDYTLVANGRFTELSRVATGDIPPGSRVLVDYRYRLPGAVDVQLVSVRLGASISVLDAVTPYVRYTWAEPERLGGDPTVQLDTVRDLVTGVRLGGPFFAADASYERNDSAFNQFRAYVQTLSLFLPRTSAVNVSLNGSHAVINYDDPRAGLRRLTAGLLVLAPLAEGLTLNGDLAWQRERWNRLAEPGPNDALDGAGARAALLWRFRAVEAELSGRFSLIERPGTVERQDLVSLRLRRTF